jgi:hypothetical protein
VIVVFSYDRMPATQKVRSGQAAAPISGSIRLLGLSHFRLSKKPYWYVREGQHQHVLTIVSFQLECLDRVTGFDNRSLEDTILAARTSTWDRHPHPLPEVRETQPVESDPRNEL